MNFFFGIKSKEIESNLTIPRFQNRCDSNKDYELYSAKIYDKHWQIKKVNCDKNEDFYFVNNI